ncbi:hypothetical protein NKG94_00920 [Micromonospora sp. M12]
MFIDRGAMVHGADRSAIRRRTRQFTAGVVGAMAVLAAVPAPAWAATWSPIQVVSEAGWSGQDQPFVAVDRQGDSLLAWAGCDSNASGCYDQVKAQTASVDGVLGPIQTLSPLGASASWPKIASDDDGDSAVVWVQDGLVAGRRVSATGELGPLRTIATWSAISPAVAVDPSGLALVTWTESRDGAYTTKARYFGADSSLGPELTLGVGGDQPVVAVDRAGTALVAWAENYERVVARRVRPEGLRPARHRRAATDVRYASVSVTLDRDGDAVISYRWSNAGAPPRLRVRHYSHTDTLGSVISVSPAAHELSLFDELAGDLDGDAVLTWGRWTSDGTQVFARTISRTGALGTVTRLGAGDWPKVTLDDDGDGLITWQAPTPDFSTSRVYARTIGQDGAFGAAEILAPTALRAAGVQPDGPLLGDLAEGVLPERHPGALRWAGGLTPHLPRNSTDGKRPGRDHPARAFRKGGAEGRSTPPSRPAVRAVPARRRVGFVPRGGLRPLTRPSAAESVRAATTSGIATPIRSARTGTTGATTHSTSPGRR